MTTRWKLTIEYEGGAFIGWQRQDSSIGITVQQTLEDAISSFTNQDHVRLHVCGRTDTGVHALGQVAHVDIEGDFDARTMREATNFHTRFLPVSICHAEKMPHDFHARFDTKKRYYCYRLTCNLPYPPQVDADRSWHIRNDLNIDAMREGASYLIGQHDFSSFRASHCQAKGPIRTIDSIEITETRDPLRPGRQIFIDIAAKSFLHHQVRNITGTLQAVGQGKLQPIDVDHILKARDRTKAAMTAPAHGLYFVKVDY